MKTFRDLFEVKGKDIGTKEIKSMILKINSSLSEDDVRAITKQVYSFITQSPNTTVNKKFIQSFMDK